MERPPSFRFSDMGVEYLHVLGTVGLVVSVIITLVYWGMDTAVGNAGSSLVHSAGKMNDRIVGVIIGVGWTIASLLILGVSLLLRASLPPRRKQRVGRSRRTRARVPSESRTPYP